MTRLVRNLILAFIPLAMGIIAAVVIQARDPSPAVVVLRADIGSVVVILTALFSLTAVVAALSDGLNELRCLHRLQNHRAERDQAHRRFIRRLDHEMKNPLTALRAALANLDEDQDQGGETVALQEAGRQAERLSRLVNDLRKLAELDERPLEKLPVDLCELLTEVVETARAFPAFTGRDVRLNVPQVPWPLPNVTGDRDLLWLAFYNLVDNALKFSAPDDPVEVRAAEDGRSITIEVADSGPGIQAEDLPRIFEELYRGKNARAAEGSGLGLALSQRIIMRHAGSLSVRTKREGPTGTVFTVRLPLKPSPVVAKASVTKS
ncbi:MAG: HAMP domain-containing histidine kinase [Chloroflexi bacterium]|nr:HAMP domain-containing sensor histidine kinase [Anaerolineaceae bacterium]NMB87346.1 HAMP domain-containing histidine kinase [Chloroflexota bacterium]